MINYKKVALAVGALSLMAIGASCTKQASTSSNSTAASVTQYQNPSVSCQVNLVPPSGSPTTLLTVTNITQSSPGLFTPPQAAAQIAFNCVGSQGHSPNSTLSAAYSVNGGPMTAFNGGLSDTNDVNLNFKNPGANSITLNLTDSAGLVTSVTFAMPVSCNPSKYPTLNGPTGMTVSAGSLGSGYANVVFSGNGSGGGGGPYQYSIDVNGDGAGVGRFDYYSPTPNSSSPPPEYWNPNPNWQNVYNFYSGQRNIYVQTYDTACQFMTTTTVPYNWSTGVLSGAQTGPMTYVPSSIPPQEPYFYMQGNVSGSSGDPAENVTPFDAREMPNPNGSGDFVQTHVICTWADQGGSNSPTQGAFSIQAINTYSDGVGADNGPMTESMSMSWNIPENGSLNLGPQSVSLQSMTYQTSASPNGAFIIVQGKPVPLAQYSYNMNSGCSAYVQVTRVTAPATCAGQSNNGYTWGNAIVQGIYSCDNMASNPSGRTINIDKGYFYCQVGPGDNCVGGGQEGGTTPTGF
jgi:hypothetical protein